MSLEKWKVMMNNEKELHLVDLYGVVLKEAYTLKLVYRGYKINDANDEQDITHEPRV